MSTDKSLPSFLRYSVHTDVGRSRDENQDNFLIFEKDDYHLYAVVDGMGGVGGGATASKMAVEILKERLGSLGRLNPLLLVSALSDVNASIFHLGKKDSKLSGMGTTFSGLVFQDHKLLLINIGDSRTYRIRGDEITQLSRDHTLANELLEAGSINKEQLDSHPGAHMLTRSLGPEKSIDPDCWWYRSSLLAHDMFIICSDGLYNLVSNEEMASYVRESASLEEATKQLVELANERGGTDNITIILVQVEEGYEPQFEEEVYSESDTIRMKRQETRDEPTAPPSGSRSYVRLGIILCCLLLIVGPLFFMEESSEQHVKEDPGLEAFFAEDGGEDIEENNANEEGSSEVSEAEDVEPKVQNFVQRGLEIEERISDTTRLLSLLKGNNKARIKERVSVVQKESESLRVQRGSIGRDIEASARELGKWINYKNQQDTNIMLKLGRELAPRHKAIKEAKENFEDLSWRYLRELENVDKNSASAEKVSAVEKLVRQREEALDTLIKEIHKVVGSQVETINVRISALTLQRYQLDQNLARLREEFSDLEIAQAAPENKKEARLAELEENLKKLKREQEALKEYLQ